MAGSMGLLLRAGQQELKHIGQLSRPGSCLEIQWILSAILRIFREFRNRSRSQTSACSTTEDFLCPSTVPAKPLKSVLQTMTNRDGESSGQQEENIRKLHGETDYDGLSIKVDGDRTCIKLTFINDTPDSYALGWANGPTVTCVTTEGEYYTSAESVRLLAGQTYEANYYFDDAAGDLISVRISNINSLDNRGLPVDFSGGGTAEIVFTT